MTEAAGKSTFLKVLEKEINFHVVPEPLSRWQSIGGGDDDSAVSLNSYCCVACGMLIACVDCTVLCSR